MTEYWAYKKTNNEIITRFYKTPDGHLDPCYNESSIVDFVKERHGPFEAKDIAQARRIALRVLSA